MPNPTASDPVRIVESIPLQTTAPAGTQDVDIVGQSVGALSIEATDLDIRDLDSAQDEVAIGDGTNTLAVNPDGSINISTGGALDVAIIEGGVVDAGNTTDVNLGAGGVFTGVGVDTLDYAAIIISLTADQVSAVDGFEFQFSVDNVTWKTTDNYTYENGGACKTYSVQTVAQYFRVNYTNGATPQTQFSLCTQLKKAAGVLSSHRVADNIEGQDDAALTKTVIAARNADGSYQNVDASPEGKLQVSVVTPVGVLPVAQLTTLHDGKLLNRMMPEVNLVDGTGTGTYAANKYDMSVTAGQWSLIQTRRYLPYFSGKPQKVELTFDNFAPEANMVKRTGGFSSNTASPYNSSLDGLWLESSGGTIHIKASRGGVITIDVPLEDWNAYDSLGEYQNPATWDNFTVCEFNYLWLGGAYIELRLVTQSGFVTAHNIIYAGTSQDVFMLSPNHPVRYDIYSTTGAGNFRYICNQVATSGSINESGLSKVVHTGHSSIVLSTVGTKYPILGIRKKAASRDNSVNVSGIDIMVASNDRILWTLEAQPSLSAALTYADVPDSPIQQAIGDGVITVSSSGYQVAGGFLEQGGKIPVDLFQENFLSYLSSGIGATMDEYVLCATPVSSNVSLHGAVNVLYG